VRKEIIQQLLEKLPCSILVADGGTTSGGGRINEYSHRFPAKRRKIKVISFCPVIHNQQFSVDLISTILLRPYGCA
jgi:hypothetical protein